MQKNDLEKTLLEIIGKFQKLIDEFQKTKKNNVSVVLLVGITGSGKSTFFNFQSGANFIINDKKELEIKNPSDNFSKMIGGMKSVTKEPNFYHNPKNNHLIIDFPGFQDTNGEWDQLLFELLFYKIVTSGPIKIIYVMKNPENSLHNRGSDLQEFIKQVCLQGNLDIQKFNLLLNCYLEDLSDEELKSNIKEELESVNILKSIDKILVLRKANKKDFQEIFSKEQRQMLWQEIEQMNLIKIQPQKLPKSEIISEYLRYTALKTIEKYGNDLCEVFDNSILHLPEQQSQVTLAQMEKLLNVIKRKNKESPLDWYINFIQICEQLTNNLRSQEQAQSNCNNFIQIFTYFSQFSNLIKGYDEMMIIKSIAEDQLKKMENIINTRIEFLQKMRHDKTKINQIQRQKSKLQKKMFKQKQQLGECESKLQDQQIEYEEEINKLKDDQEQCNQEYKHLEEQYQKELNDQNVNQQKELYLLKQQFNEFRLCQMKKDQTQELKNKIKDQENQMNLMKYQIEQLKNKSSCQIF